MSELFKRFKKALGIGLAMEVAFCGTGYYFYRKYKSDDAFRQMIQQDYPELHESFKKSAEWYLSLLPEKWSQRILDDKPELPKK